MSRSAVIDCDLDGCDKRQAFPPEASPPLNWYLVTHPAVKHHGRSVVAVKGMSTFCSPEHLALWAKDHVPARPTGATA